MTTFKHMNDLSIPVRFLEQPPKATKIEAKRKMFRVAGQLPPVTVTPTGCAIDGYTGLLVQLENGVTDIKCVVATATKAYGRVVSVSEMPEFMALVAGRIPLEKFSPGRHSAHDETLVFSAALATLIEKQNNRCYICGREMVAREALDVTLTTNTATLDHILPRALGGTNVLENLAASCHRCNQLKGQLMFSKELARIIITQREYEEALEHKAGLSAV